MSHTLGPWKIRADLAITAYDTETEEHQPIARAFGNGSCETLFANTRLIAAAPDLIDLLYHALPCVEESEEFDKPTSPKLSAKIRAIIKQIEGE